jgi:Putative zinc-finger
MTHHQAVETMAAERYLLDELSEIERYRFEEHFFECEECAEVMRLGHQLRVNAKHVFAGAAPEESVAPHTSHVAEKARGWWAQPLRVAIPWAAAAVLALVLIYPGRSALGPATGDLGQVFAPTTLRPASRGAITNVTVPETGAAALALDVNIGSPGDAITYTLSREQGEIVKSERVFVPASGVPLIALVSADQVGEGGTFVVTLTPAADPSTPPAEYRFNAIRR